jgi:hypothetical protein
MIQQQQVPENILETSVRKYFAVEQRWSDVYPYLAGQTKVSFRMLDFLTNKYSRYTRCEFVWDNRLVNIAVSNQMVMAALQRRYIDTFRRKAKCGPKLQIGFPGKEIDTTLAQLVFFRWAHQNGVLQYAEQHQEVIRSAMRQTNQMRKKRKLADSNMLPDRIIVEL